MEGEDDDILADEDVLEIPYEPQMNSDIGANLKVCLRYIPFPLQKSLVIYCYIFKESKNENDLILQNRYKWKIVKK